MNRTWPRRNDRQGWLSLFAMFACLSLASRGQSQTVVRITRSGAATAQSAAIMAQSDYLRAQGDFLTSAATARKTNAEAEEHELRNAVQWVHTYFERRRLFREYRAAENPTFLQKEEARYQNYHRLIQRNPLTVLGSDVTDELNWMLRDLMAHSSYQIFLPDYSDSLLNSPDNIPLSSDDVHHLRLGDGNNAGGKTLVFRADTAQMLETRWPLALRDERFDAERANFESARDAALADLKANKKLGRAAELRLMKTLDELSDGFSAAYPPQRQGQSSQVFLAYASGKRYLQSLALSTYRLIETQSQSAFDDSYRFQGKNVAELLQHLMNKGLEFAPPEPGDEGVYRKLFVTVRKLYLAVVPEPKAK